MIQARDACDPATFPPGLCARADNSGRFVTLQELVARFRERGSHGAWTFAPDEVSVKAGQSVIARGDRAHEPHTFSNVTSTGFLPKACIPDVNQILFDDPAVPPECGTVFTPESVVIPGVNEVPVDTSRPGTQLFQCLIHPWMHATVKVRS